MKFQKGDIVLLKKSAIKGFYGTNKILEMYEYNRDFTSESFVEFITDYTGFDNGENAGIVMYENMGGTFAVRFFSCVTGLWKTRHFEEKELKLVKRTLK